MRHRSCGTMWWVRPSLLCRCGDCAVGSHGDAAGPRGAQANPIKSRYSARATGGPESNQPGDWVPEALAAEVPKRLEAFFALAEPFE